ncbi:thiamine transporter 1-like [Toxorhynchites rutilus septentrionalis]|uniref:thiamine transporter 1-like n=1 Tax=Toxorhynchites rutilus septentrionalis TaxID=329112 RepID=UPI0024784D7A|nr:thiamine transporter 1-like [Toxorhynchites rutilus septentrionalis]
MKEWRSIAILLSVFGFLKDFRPSDPFLVQFLNGPCHNISTQQIQQDLFPVGTYSFGTQLVITFLITDYLRYKPLIVLAGLAGIAYWCLFIWARELKWLQLAQIFYGTYKAADVAFWSYIYASVDRSYYQKITSYTRSASLVGKFAAAVSSQLLLFYGLVTDYLDLNYLSLAVQTCTTAIALFLPPAPKSVYFNRQPAKKDQNLNEPVSNARGTETPTSDPDAEKLTPMELLWYHIKSSYSTFVVLRYSLWYALESCIYYQTMLYAQVLWRTIANTRSTGVLWNGAVEAVLTICSAIITFSAGFVPEEALKVPNTLLGLSWISFAQGGILLLAALAPNLWVAYGSHIVFSALHSFTVTLLNAEIAKNICRDSFGLVFGINASVGSVLQILVTLVVVNGLSNTDVVGQFIIFGGICGAIGLLFWTFLLIELRSCWKHYLFRIQQRLTSKRKIEGTDNHSGV